MLVLTRSEGEEIQLTCPDGTLIWIRLVEVMRGNRAKIGIDAPQSVKVMREELLEKEERRGT